MIRTFLFASFLVFASVSYGQEMTRKDTVQVTQPASKPEVTKDSVRVAEPPHVIQAAPVVAKDTVKVTEPLQVIQAAPAVAKDTVKVTQRPKSPPPKDTVKEDQTLVTLEIQEKNPPIDNKDIMGKWQMESTEMADGFYYTYSFLRGNVFVFGNDENEGLNRIISLTGTYYLKQDTLIIYVKQEYDLVGGTPQMSEKLAGSGWEIKGGKIMLKDLPIVREYYLPIKTCPVKDHKKCIEINSMSYYKFE